MDANTFIVIPSTTKFVRLQDFNSVVIKGELISTKKIVPPTTKEDRFYLETALFIKAFASINIQSHKFDRDIRDKEVEETVLNEEVKIDLENLNVSETKEDLISSAAFKALPEESLKVADSRIDFYFKTLTNLEQRDVLLLLKKAEDEEETEAMEVKEEGPTKLDIELHKVQSMLDKNLHKQESRVQVLTEYVGNTSVLMESDNLYDLTKYLFETKLIDGRELFNINEEIRSSVTTLYGILSGGSKNVVHMMNPNEETYNSDFETTDENTQPELTEDIESQSSTVEEEVEA